MCCFVLVLLLSACSLTANPSFRSSPLPHHGPEVRELYYFDLSDHQAQARHSAPADMDTSSCTPLAIARLEHTPLPGLYTARGYLSEQEQTTLLSAIQQRTQISALSEKNQFMHFGTSQ